jgi:hypothetical protein
VTQVTARYYQSDDNVFWKAPFLNGTAICEDIFMRILRFNSLFVSLLLALLIAAFPTAVGAHCDGMDGPVVKAAQRALEKGNVNLALIWVLQKDEREVTAAFQRAVAVRKLSREARELADRYFFETLVRLHRAGEGESYEGLKPAGRDLGPAIPAADKAIDTGSIQPLLGLFPAASHTGVRERFAAAAARKNYKMNDVEAGREYVKAYVSFMHYVEEQYGSENAAHDHHQTSVPGTQKDVHATAEQHRHETKEDRIGEIRIPRSLKTEHDELHSELAKAIAAGGRVGEAAKEVASLLHPHFVKEEEYALPQLGLLRTIAEGRVTPEMAQAIALADRLKAELPEMLKEHKAIVAALDKLANSAKAENKMSFVHFAEKLTLHAQTEEEVLYPASILIGDYLKLTLRK